MNLNFLNKRTEIWATLFVALSGMLYGFIGFLGTKLARVDHLSISNMLFWRFFIASLWMIIFNFFTQEKLFKELPNVRTLAMVLIFGSFFYSVSSGFYFLATRETGTGLAMVIFFSFPMFVALFSWLMNKWQINKFAVCALIAMLCGLFMLKGEGNTTVSLLGIAIAILSGVSYAFYVIGVKHNVHALPATLNTIIICSGNAFIFFIFAAINHSFVIPTGLHAWIYICVLGIFATALPIQLVLYSLKIISSVKASILSVLEPVVTLLVGVAMLHESMSLIQMLGVAVILFGAVLIQFEKA